MRVPVSRYVEAGRRVETPGRDVDPLAVRRSPEEARPTLTAERASRVSVASRAGDPAQAAVLDEREVILAGCGERPYAADPATALLAVAEQDVAKRPVYLVADGAA